MITSLASNVLSAWFSFLLPCYGTWKSLAHDPVSQNELEHWAMYWSVMGALVAFENVAQWLVSWLPFYWEVKTLFLLYLALPQTQGSVWVFQSVLHPYFSKNEVEIDASIVAAKTNIVTFVQSRSAMLWQSFIDAAMKGATNGAGPSQVPAGAVPTGPIDVAKGLWSAYGSALLGNLQAPAGPANHPNRPVATPASSSASIASYSSESSAASSGPSSHSAEPSGYQL